MRALAAAALAALLAAAPSASAGEPISLPGLERGELSETDLERGEHVLIVWASWSPHCRDIVSRANRVTSAWAGRAEVHTVVFQEKPEAVRSFLGRERLAAPTFIDTAGAFSKKHAVTSLPGLLIFRGGELVFSGKLPTNPDPLIERHLG